MGKNILLKLFYLLYARSSYHPTFVQTGVWSICLERNVFDVGDEHNRRQGDRVRLWKRTLSRRWRRAHLALMKNEANAFGAGDEITHLA